MAYKLQLYAFFFLDLLKSVNSLHTQHDNYLLLVISLGLFPYIC